MKALNKHKERQDLGTMIAGCRDRAEDLRMDLVSYLLDMALLTMDNPTPTSPPHHACQWDERTNPFIIDGDDIQ